MERITILRAGLGEAWHGEAGLGTAWLGLARHGKVSREKSLLYVKK